MDDKKLHELVTKGTRIANDDFIKIFTKFMNGTMPAEESYIVGLTYLSKLMELCIASALLVENEDEVDKFIMISAKSAAKHHREYLKYKGEHQ